VYVELSVQTAERESHSGLGGSIFPNAAWRLVWALRSLKDEDEKILISGFYDDIQPPSEKDLDLLAANNNFYELHFENIGGLVMPLIIRATFVDGTEEIIRIPAEVWMRDNYNISKVFIFEEEVVSFRLDPFLETGDTNLNNNAWPKEVKPSRYQLFQEKKMNENPMQRQKRMN
ncbi:MAG: hypothetical protein R3333_14080, partial [Lishizhenia sp.]|nr:hypothetical protein [Lishizhenia sp.]